MSDLEDGEVLDSDDGDQPRSNLAQVPVPQPQSTKESTQEIIKQENLFERDKQPQSTVMQNVLGSYRNTRSAVYCSSDDSNLSSDEDSVLWQRKRAKYSASQKKSSMDICPSIPEARCLSSSSVLVDKSKPSRRTNNIWGSVLTEQTLTQDLVGVGVNTFERERSVESYDYTRAQEDTRPFLADKVADTEVPHDPFEQVLQETASEERGRKRKKPVKDRIGQRTYDKTKSRHHIGVTEEDSEPAIVNAISNVLDEPKIALIDNVVKVVGKKKALELLYLTEDVEETGGMMTMDGYRRRTPGGVYIQLLKTDKDISRKQRNKIFAEDRKEYNRERKKAKRQPYNRNTYEDHERSPSPMSNDGKDIKSDDIAEVIIQVKKEQMEKPLNEDENMEDCIEENDYSESKVKSEHLTGEETMNTSNEMDGADGHEQDVLGKKTNTNGSVAAANKSFNSDDALRLDADDDLIF
ncbi:hypothetical protein ScPMuIL_017569 [Solemya velum]